MSPRNDLPATITPVRRKDAIDLLVEGKDLVRALRVSVTRRDSGARTLTPSAPLALHAQDRGTDNLGAFAARTFPLTDGKARQLALLHFRAYVESPVIVAHLDYRTRRRLDPDCGFKVEIGEAPHFRRGCGAALRSPCWTAPFFTSSFHSLPDQAQFYLWEQAGNRYVCIIPLCGGGMKGWLKGEGEKLSLCLASYDRNFVPREVPLFAIAYGNDPYTVVEGAYRAGIAAMTRPRREVRLRTEKRYPDVFEYIGWCSWNAYYQNVDAQKLLRAARSFKENKFPVRFILIDDGWFAAKNRRLVSFDSPREKCPGGLANLVADLKRNYGIRWVGIWHTLQGYWEGIEPRSALGRKYAEHLLQGKNGMYIPHPEPKKGFRFWSDWHDHFRCQGIDFVKVDNQSTMREITRDRMPIGRAMSQQQHNLQSSVTAHFQGWMINCMAMSAECCYNWISSNVSRSSDDYWPDRRDDPKVHAYDNSYNSLWFSQLTYPDFDMFESHHPQGEFHAVLRAVSGGPVYFTDTPGKENWKLLRKLVFSDGKILRPDHPCLPTRDVLFVDPMKEGVPLKVFTTAGPAGIVAAFNVNKDGETVVGHVSPPDVHGLRGGRFVIYDHLRKKVHLVEKRGGIPVTLSEFECALYIISPVKDGFAPLGLIDKYISPKAVLSVHQQGKTVRIELVEGGRLACFCTERPQAVFVNGKLLPERKWQFREGLLKVSLPMKRGNDKRVCVEIAIR